MNDRAPGAALLGLGLVVVAGCQVAATDNGCQVARQLVLPDTTPLALIPDVQIERAGAGFVLLGVDDTSVRWTVIDANGRFDVERSFELPPGTVRAYYGLAGAESPGDRVIIGLLTPAANGSDAELHLVAAPTDGSTPPAPGIAIATFGGGASAQSPPSIAMGTSASAMYAGVAWIDTGPLLPMYAFVDGQGEMVGQPAVIDAEPVAGFDCLGFGPGKQELTISYQRAPLDSRLAPNWLIADVMVGGGLATLKLNVALPGGIMSCARSVLYTPAGGGSPEYAIVWQDASGSWLSIYYGPQTNMLKSFPFASSTDFGGAGLQPQLVGLAAFGNDFGVLFARSRSVELWRIDQLGDRHAGTLVLPSRQGDIGPVSSISSSSTGRLTSTYADLTGAGMGRRLVVDAACY